MTDEINEMTEETPSTDESGLNPNLAGALSYFLGPVSGIYFWMTEKENQFVRFHAMQSILFCVAYVIISVVINIIPILGQMIALLLSIAGIFIWLMLMYRAYNGEEWELPFIGKIARDQL